MGVGCPALTTAGLNHLRHAFLGQIHPLHFHDLCLYRSAVLRCILKKVQEFRNLERHSRQHEIIILDSLTWILVRPRSRYHLHFSNARITVCKNFSWILALDICTPYNLTFHCAPNVKGQKSKMSFKYTFHNNIIILT